MNYKIKVSLKGCVFVSVSKEALRGYLLEEVLAYLIKGTGYNLLVDESQDMEELKNRRHGLVVKGRGAEHQADVLGQLKWIPAFTYPIRLFVEAKFRKTKTGIGPVRNAVGIIEDLNQNYTIKGTKKILVRRYNYNYVLFSVSGFSEDAVNMAIAHRISLVDLSASDFKPLIECIDKTADRIIKAVGFSEEIASAGDDSMNRGLGDYRRYSSTNFINLLRKYLRIELGTFPIELLQEENIVLFPDLSEIGQEIFNALFRVVKEEYKMLFVAMANGPFMLVIKAEDPQKFLSFARENPSQRINISWNRSDNDGRRWTIVPIDCGNDGFKLTFTLPEELSKFIFESDDPKETALEIKSEIFSDITIYNFNHSKDELYRLRYLNVGSNEQRR